MTLTLSWPATHRAFTALFTFKHGAILPARERTLNVLVLSGLSGRQVFVFVAVGYYDECHIVDYLETQQKIS